MKHSQHLPGGTEEKYKYCNTTSVLAFSFYNYGKNKAVILVPNLLIQTLILIKEKY
jgi:hypothetical protein